MKFLKWCKIRRFFGQLSLAILQFKFDFKLGTTFHFLETQHKLSVKRAIGPAVRSNPEG